MHITRKEGNIYLCTSKGAATTPPYFDPLPSPASAYPIPKFLCILRSSRHSLREREREGEFPIFKPNVVSLPAQTSRGIPRSTHTHTRRTRSARQCSADNRAVRHSRLHYECAFIRYKSVSKSSPQSAQETFLGLSSLALSR